MKQLIYNTALYLRLSRDDELSGESGSISTQRMMLRQYAQEHGLNVVDEYIDDGWSGTNFDRPAFQRMIDDIEDGKINCVITKDLSRLGRNYVMTGQYTDFYFPSKGVRYIAINDNVDTLNGESELAPFLNILNEMHARQTSKKVKTALRTKFANGLHIGAYAPLGYMRDPEQKGHLLIDPDTRWIVEKIFDLAVHGMGAAKITHILHQDRVPTPGYLNYQRYGTFAHIYAGQPEDKAYNWSIGHVKCILKNEVYIGHSVHNQQTNISFKNKKKVRKPEDEWFKVENTHEAIISEEDFRRVQEMIDTRRRSQKNGELQLFAGLIKCADCGWSLGHGRRKTKNGYDGYYHCSKNGQGLHQCSMHYIREDVLCAYVLSRLQYWSQQAQQNEEKLLKRLMGATDRERSAAKKKQAAELRKAEKRKAEIDSLFMKMYEDWSDGRITEYNFNMLSEKYQTEQQELDAKIQSPLDGQRHSPVLSWSHTGEHTKELLFMTFNFDMHRIGQTIARLRREHNMTQMQLADEMGVSFQAVSNWERGQSMPDISKLPELATLFSTTIDELLGHHSPLIEKAAEGKLGELPTLTVEEVVDAAPLLPPRQMDTLTDKLLESDHLPDMTELLPFLPTSKVDELLRQRAADDENLSAYVAFASTAAVDEIALSRLQQEESISQLVPFMSQNAIDTLARNRETNDQSISFLLPFMSTAALNDATISRLKNGQSISDLLPFLSQDMLQKLFNAASIKD